MIKPPQFSLRTVKDEWGAVRGRLAPDKLHLFIEAFLNGKLKLNYRSAIMGPEYRQWMECRAESDKGWYYFAFGVKDMTIVQLWAVITPKGNAYDIDVDGGDTLGSVPVDKLRSLTELLIDRDRELQVLARKEAPKSKASKKRAGLR